MKKYVLKDIFLKVSKLLSAYLTNLSMKIDSETVLGY